MKQLSVRVNMSVMSLCMAALFVSLPVIIHISTSGSTKRTESHIITYQGMNAIWSQQRRVRARGLAEDWVVDGDCRHVAGRRNELQHKHSVGPLL